MEATSNGRFLRRDQAPAEALVVALSPFEASVDEEVEPHGFRKRTIDVSPTASRSGLDLYYPVGNLP